MASFKIKKEDLKKFLEVCSMEGSIQFRDGKSIKKALFNAFIIQVDPVGCIRVLTVDTHRKKTDALFIKSGVEVLEEGEIPITSYSAIAGILKGKGISGDIIVTNTNDILKLESDKDVYEIRQKISEDLESLKNDADINKHLMQWLKWHKFDGENETLVMHHPKQDVSYPMRIKVSKEDLLKVVGDTINITKDNKTKLIFKKNVFSAHKGEANASITSRHRVDFVDSSLKDEKGNLLNVEFDEDFYSLQTIIPNLFDDITLNIRRVRANKSITIYLSSYDEKTGIEINLGLASIIKAQEEK